jgi:enoyl-CoA hydratase/carnithine racemase
MTLVATDIDRSAGIATVILNRPEARNPTSIALLDDLDRAIDVVEGESSVRAMILGGAGRAFCAGLDLAEVRAEEQVVRTMLRRLSEVMRRVRRLSIVTVARVQGAAIGGGFGFMAVCDFRLTHAEVLIGYPPLAACLSPALMSPWLARIVGPARAAELLLGGGTITGARAHELGIATHLAPRDELDRAARRIAEGAIAGGRYATEAMKALLLELDAGIDDALLDRAATVSADVIVHPESRARQREAVR